MTWWAWALIALLGLLFLPAVLKVAAAVQGLSEAILDLWANGVAWLARSVRPRTVGVAAAALMVAVSGFLFVVLVDRVPPFVWLCHVVAACWWIDLLARGVRDARRGWSWWRARRAEPLPSVREQLARYAGEVEAGRVLWPDVYAARVRALQARGVCLEVCDLLRHAGDVRLLRDVESLDEWQIRWLNWAARR